MSVSLRIILILAAIISSVYVVIKIRKSQMKIEEATYWIFFAGLLIVLSIFPGIAFWLTSLIGIESPANLVYLVMIFIVLGKLFSLSVKNSQLEYKLSILAEEIAIWRNYVEKIQAQEPKDSQESGK